MRSLLAISLAFVAFVARAAVQRAEINFDYVRDLAVRRAAEPYRPPKEELPPRMAALTYDDYRKIEFRSDRALWRADNLPFQLQLFPRGGLFPNSVTVHEFSRTHVQTIPFDATYFQLGPIHELPKLPENLGYAGIKIFHPLDRADASAEVASFLGASYFRALGAGQHYGLSARGLALDAAVDGRREEFPHFSELWVGKPEPGATALTLHGLLDGPSVAGAFEFIITPGKATFVDVRAALVFRATDKLPGFAPLTSMFWYGENTERPKGQMRPEVHDSDGLFVRDEGGRQIWRPLRNPDAPQAAEIPVRGLSRFGLAQRDRRIQSYEDREGQYERRPTAWVEPRDGWGPGTVRLAELPAMLEYGDNIVVYWVPENRPAVGVPVALRYRVVWGGNTPHDEPTVHVVATREGNRPGNAKGRLWWIDFTDTKSRERGATKITADVEVGPGGRLAHSSINPYPEIDGWRVAVEVEAENSATRPVELRCRLRNNEGVISEEWLYQWQP